MLQDITNYLEITPRLGTAGQPSPDELASIQQAGYQVVINLLPETSSAAIPDEGDMVRDLGMDYIHIPVIWDQPTPADLEQFFQAMQQSQNRKVFVHCAMNMRVSAFVFLYRVLKEGETEAVAKQSMHKIWEPNPTWQAFIDQSLAS